MGAKVQRVTDSFFNQDKREVRKPENSHCTAATTLCLNLGQFRGLTLRRTHSLSSKRLSRRQNEARIRNEASKKAKPMMQVRRQHQASLGRKKASVSTATQDISRNLWRCSLARPNTTLNRRWNHTRHTTSVHHTNRKTRFRNATT